GGFGIAAWFVYKPALVLVAILFSLAAGGIGWWLHYLRHAPRLVFDRGRGEMGGEPPGRRQPTPLAGIVAVQLNGGRVLRGSDDKFTTSSSAPGVNTADTQTYEVNVILDDHPGGMHILEDRAREEMQAAGMGSVTSHLGGSPQDRRRFNL